MNGQVCRYLTGTHQIAQWTFLFYFLLLGLIEFMYVQGAANEISTQTGQT